jgi:hypothetical protein
MDLDHVRVIERLTDLGFMLQVSDLRFVVLVPFEQRFDRDSFLLVRGFGFENDASLARTDRPQQLIGAEKISMD